mgnify:CR=1 FL=1
MVRETVRQHQSRDIVLVVDDEKNNRRLVDAYLSAEDYDVRLAKSGEEALEIIHEAIPRVIILDVKLPGISGYELCRRLKSNEKFTFIPIVMATALRGNEQRRKGIEAGADDFINKPYNRIELITRIKSLVRISRLHSALALKVRELEKAQKKLGKLAVTDGLTSLYNYRAFRHQLHLELSRAERFAMSVSLLMIDIDRFKNYNDRFGHPAGDTLLQQFAKLLKRNVRELDCVARYGGEEFVIILPGTEKKSAGIVAEKIRSFVARAPFLHVDKLKKKMITVSIGCATYPEDTKDEEQLIKLADKTLYQAKENGRNQTVLYSCNATA